MRIPRWQTDCGIEPRDHVHRHSELCLPSFWIHTLWLEGVAIGESTSHFETLLSAVVLWSTRHIHVTLTPGPEWSSDSCGVSWDV